jgi:hypothetical protein
MVLQVLELVGTWPRHIQLVVRNEEELSKLLGAVTIAAGSVMPNMQRALLPKKAGNTGGHRLRLPRVLREGVEYTSFL